MSRDTERYAYFTVGIPRDSETYQKLLQDAQETGKQDAIASLLTVRIADFYKLTTTTLTTRAVPSPEQVEEPEEETTHLDLAAINANAALDEWG